MDCLAILGASGHGKVAMDAALSAGWKKIVFFDALWPELKEVNGIPVEGDEQAFFSRAASFAGRIIAIGNNQIRLEKAHQLKLLELAVTTVVHSRAFVSTFARIGQGTLVLANAVVNVGADLGECCIVNTGATVDHDCLLGDAVHISPGANLAGHVQIGALSWIGIGACIRQKITIGRQVMVGAGAAVIRDIDDYVTVVGVPGEKV